MKTLLVYNPKSGKGKIKRDLNYIECYFNTKGVHLDVFHLCKQQELKTYIRSHSHKYEIMLVAGGDGTVNAVVDALMHVDKGLRPRILIMPYGTTNDMASILGMKKNLKKQLAFLDTNMYQAMDVYRLNDCHFTYAAAVGKFSRISYDINRKHLRIFGRIAYFFNTLRDLGKPYRMQVKVEAENQSYELETFLVLMLSANRVSRFHLKRFSNQPKLDDGFINVRLLKRSGIPAWIKMIIFYLRNGKLSKSDLHLTVKKIKIKLDRDWIWNVDGEKSVAGNVEVEVMPQAIEVYLADKQMTKLFQNK